MAACGGAQDEREDAVLSSHNPLAESRLRPGKQRSDVVLDPVGSVSILGMFEQLCATEALVRCFRVGGAEGGANSMQPVMGIRKSASVGLASRTKLRRRQISNRL